jgi:hypothetical protein
MLNTKSQIYILYRLEPKLIDTKPNGWYMYIPTDVLSSIENGYNIIDYVDLTLKETGKNVDTKTIRERTFVGTFDQLSSTLELDWEKRLEKRYNCTYMPYDFFLCTTPLQEDHAFPKLIRNHQKVLYKGQEPYSRL